MDFRQEILSLYPTPVQYVATLTSRLDFYGIESRLACCTKKT